MRVQALLNVAVFGKLTILICFNRKIIFQTGVYPWGMIMRS